MRQKAMFIVPYALWIILFVIAPLVLIFYQSFFNINGQLTLNNYAEYLTSGVYLKMTLNSVWYAFLITLVTLVISYPTAYVLNRLPNKQFWLLLVILPTWINLLLKTYAFIGLFSRTGTINGFLQFMGLGSHQLLFTDTSFMFVAAYIEIPFMVLPIFNNLAEINPSLINASYDSLANLSSGDLAAFYAGRKSWNSSGLHPIALPLYDYPFDWWKSCNYFRDCD